MEKEVGVIPQISNENGSRERREMYDKSAGLYTATFPLIWQYLFPGVHDWLATELEGCRYIMDAGTGPGYWANYISQAGERKIIAGMDFSHEYLLRARSRVSPQYVQLVEGDINHSPFRSDQFDAILCSGVLDTFPEVEPAFREFHRLLKHKGKLLLILRGKGSILSRLDEMLFRSSIGMAKMIKNRSVSAFRLQDNIWNRIPILGRIQTLARETGFQPKSINGKRMIATVTLIREVQ